MKTLLLSLLLMASMSLVHAEVKLDTVVANGPITAQCSYVDKSDWPLILRIQGPTMFTCLIDTLSFDTVEFIVSIVSQDESGAVHLHTITTASVRGHSIAIFPTTDKKLVSLSVSERRAPIVFMDEDSHT